MDRLRIAASRALDETEDISLRGKRRRLNEATLNLLRSAAHYGEWHWFRYALNAWIRGHAKLIRTYTREVFLTE